jgi:molybdopterin converting factor small subunit
MGRPALYLNRPFYYRHVQVFLKKYAGGAMRVKVLYFGVLKDYFGDSADVGLPEGASVADLLQQQRDLANVALESIAVAVNRDYAKLTDVLHEGDEVALLPPVSGGCEPLRLRSGQAPGRARASLAKAGTTKIRMERQ